jgi:hypothetical protein
MSGSYDGRSRELGYRTVIGMAVRAVRSEGKDHLRSESSDMCSDCSGGFARIYLIESTVGITETVDLGDAQHSRSGEKFCFAQRAKLSRRTASGCAAPAAFSARGCKQKCLRALGGITGHGSAQTQGLIVGMSDDSQQSETHLNI